MEKNVKDRSKWVLIIIIFVTLIVWQLPYGNLMLYPFTILGTWFHEMGHGIMAMLLGADFIRLELYANGSGLAVHSGNVWFGGLGRAMVAAAGPLGPTIAGAIFIMSSNNTKAVKFLLIFLSIVMLLSVILYIRSLFGVLFISFFGILILYSAVKTNDNICKIMLQFLGVQSFASLYLSMGYLFSTGGSVNGSSYMSDTGVIADNLFLPHWFWAGAIVIISVIIMLYSIIHSFRGKAVRY
jgi:hypothetical protein